MIISTFIGHYQEFSFQKSLVNNFYKNSKDVDGDEGASEPEIKIGTGEDPMNDSLLNRLSARPSQEIFYFDHLQATMATIFCFFRRHSGWYKTKIKRVKEHEEAVRRMGNEIDLLNVVTLLR